MIALDKIPTRKVVEIDHEAVIKRLLQGPMLLKSLDRTVYQAIYQSMRKHGVKPTYRTLHVVDGGKVMDVKELRMESV